MENPNLAGGTSRAPGESTPKNKNPTEQTVQGPAENESVTERSAQNLTKNVSTPDCSAQDLTRNTSTTERSAQDSTKNASTSDCSAQDFTGSTDTPDCSAQDFTGSASAAERSAQSLLESESAPEHSAQGAPEGGGCTGQIAQSPAVAAFAAPGGGFSGGTAFAAPGTGFAAGAAAFAAQAVAKAPKKPEIMPDKKDALFALLFFGLGYLFIHWCMFWYNCFHIYYNIIYAAVVLAYVYARGKRPPAESWFWLGVMLCLNGPLYLFPKLYGYGPLGPGHQSLLLIFVAAYWALCACGALSEGKTSSWVVLDAANAFFFVPFGNFWRQCGALVHGARGTVAGRRALYVALGLLLALPLLFFVLPQLLMADARFELWLSQMFSQMDLMFTIIKLVLALPVSAFLYGLCYGGLYRRNTEVVPRGGVRKLGEALRVVPNLAVATALGVVCALYLLFIVFQSGYLFSAFSGYLPDGYTYAECARSGFFELCRVCGVNVVFLLGANLFSKTRRAESKLLRCMNLTLSALTLLLIATAGSKLALYITTYGLTLLRVLSSLFLLWLAIVFALIMVWQFRPIAPVRPAVLAGAAIVALLCALPVSAGIDAYNAAHFPASSSAGSFEAGGNSSYDYDYDYDYGYYDYD